MSNCSPYIKHFHFIWVDSKLEKNPNPLIPEHCRGFIQTWQLIHPDWEITIWNGASIHELVLNHFPEYMERFCQYNRWICRVDIAKYFIMYHCGGVYLDTDIECIRNIGPLLETPDCRDIIVSKEPDENAALAYKNAISYVPSNALLISRKNHDPFWKACVEHVLTRQKFESLHILLATGPPTLYTFLESSDNRSKVTILPSSFFFGLKPKESRESFHIREDTYGIHHWANMWCNT